MEVLPRLIKFATLRPRSAFEIKQWLLRKKVSLQEHEKLQGELALLGLLDDAAFVRWWIEQRTTFRPKARRMLALELRRKGVEREVIEKVLNDELGISDDELAFSLVERKKKMFDRLDPETRKKKIIAILSSRGFTWDVIRTVLNED